MFSWFSSSKEKCAKKYPNDLMLMTDFNEAKCYGTYPPYTKEKCVAKLPTELMLKSGFNKEECGKKYPCAECGVAVSAESCAPFVTEQKCRDKFGNIIANDANCAAFTPTAQKCERTYPNSIANATNCGQFCPAPTATTCAAFAANATNCGSFCPAPLSTKMVSAKGCQSDNYTATCPLGKEMVGTVKYGRWDNSTCPHATVNASTPAKASFYDIRKMPTSTDLRREDPYPGVYKQWELDYACVDKA